MAHLPRCFGSPSRRNSHRPHGRPRRHKVRRLAATARGIRPAVRSRNAKVAAKASTKLVNRDFRSELALKEVPLNWNKWMRQSHRWLSLAFTLVVIVNGVAVAQKRYTNSLGLLAVFVLALQFFTGLYLFVLPYVSKWRSAQGTD